MEHSQEDKGLSADSSPTRRIWLRPALGSALLVGVTVGLLLLFGRLAIRLEATGLPWYLIRFYSIGGFALLEVLSAIALWQVVERRSVGQLFGGLGMLRFWFLWGIAIGTIANGFAPAILSLTGEGWLLPLPEMPAAPKLAAALLVPLSAFWEELIYRGCLLRWLRPVGTLTALLFTSVLFAGLHFVAEPLYLDRFAVLLGMGLLFGFAFLATDTVWFPIGIHLGINIIGYLLTNDAYSGGVWRFAIAVSRTSHAIHVLAGLALGMVLAHQLVRARSHSGLGGEMTPSRSPDLGRPLGSREP